MALLKIYKYPDGVLRVKAVAVEGVTEERRTLIDNMIDTMYDAPGIGLAAPQVGVSERIIVLDVPDNPGGDGGGDGEECDLQELRETPKQQRGKNLIAIVNPEIVDSGGTVRFDEACLSLPGISAEVERKEWVRVTGLDKDGAPLDIEAYGLLAICLQHEIDHLDGILFIDHLSKLKQQIYKRRLKKGRALAEAEAKEMGVEL